MKPHKKLSQPFWTICTAIGWLCLAVGQPIAAAESPVKFRGTHAVTASADGSILVEAEEFQPAAKSVWKAKPWGENYYAATFANSFLSRKAFLGAPEQATNSTATIQVQVPKAGRYLVLARYEAAYRFETQFRVRVEQAGKPVLDRLYGARSNLKIWAFGEKLKTELSWSWGASENIVWEGHDAFAQLEPGLATITLTAATQPEPAARRNVDCLLLTTDEAQVKMRIEKENYLPLDGMLTQTGDVFVKVTNLGAEPLVFAAGSASGGGNWQQHSPYWVHLRNWPAVKVEVAAGKTSDWAEVGGTMDTLNDGQWEFAFKGKCRAVFGLKTAAGKIETIATFEATDRLRLAADADTRYSRRLRLQENLIHDLLAEIKKEPLRGRAPTETLIFGGTFSPGLGAGHDAAVVEFKKLFTLADTETGSTANRVDEYIDVRGVATDKLAEYCQKLGARAQRIACVSLGDEIGLPAPGAATAQTEMVAWLKTQSLQPKDVLPGATDWAQVTYHPKEDIKAAKPGIFYWSKRFEYHYGIQAIKQRTDILRRHLPNAGIGANYSPHYPANHRYLGEVHKWMTIFREDGMTLPWGEDYIFQMPVGTAQMNNINLDMFRAGIRGKPAAKIHYYCMPHWPGNTPETWRRLFFDALGHGMQMVNLFEFRPVQAAYTENHCSLPEMYRMILRSFRELGQFEDIIQAGRNRPAQTALWFSETGDIWDDNHGSFGAAKRALYTAILHQQAPLDFVIEPDALNGTLNNYRVLYLTDAHVSQSATKQISAWVAKGGTLFVTAGGGMFDELNRPNSVLRELAGVEQTALDEPAGAQVEMIKQDLPFVTAIDTASWQIAGEGKAAALPVIGVRSRVTAKTAKVVAKLADGTPAITERAHGSGKIIYCAFLPGLTYYQPATPKRPVDRGTVNESFAHFIPTQFHPAASALIGSALANIERPVTCSEKLVEPSVIQSAKGTAIILVNWGAGPVKKLRVTTSLPIGRVELASGRPVKVEGKDLVLDLDLADVLILR